MAVLPDRARNDPDAGTINVGRSRRPHSLIRASLRGASCGAGALDVGSRRRPHGIIRADRSSAIDRRAALDVGCGRKSDGRVRSEDYFPTGNASALNGRRGRRSHSRIQPPRDRRRSPIRALDGGQRGRPHGHVQYAGRSASGCNTACRLLPKLATRLRRSTSGPLRRRRRRRFPSLRRAGSPTASFALSAVDPSAADALSFAAAAGDPTATFNLVAVAPPATQALSVAARAGDPTARFNLSALTPEAVPDAPTMFAASEVARDSALLRWAAPADANPAITRYDIRIGTGAWMSTGSVGTTFRLTGLVPGTEYSITVRAVNSVGEGTASSAITFRTLAILAPGPPLFPRLESGAGMCLDLLWEPPINDGGGAITAYEAFFCDEANQHCGWESVWTAGALRHRFRGLRAGGRYRVVMRARNGAGVSGESEAVEASPYVMPAAVTMPVGANIPLLDADRQSLIVRLDGRDCRIRVWWQPSDSGWWGSLEVPTNTPAVTGRRLSLNAGLLDRLDGILAGNLVLRDLGGAGVEPGRDAFRAGTHALRWEPSSGS